MQIQIYIEEICDSEEEGESVVTPLLEKISKEVIQILETDLTPQVKEKFPGGTIECNYVIDGDGFGNMGDEDVAPFLSKSSSIIIEMYDDGETYSSNSEWFKAGEPLNEAIPEILFYMDLPNLVVYLKDCLTYYPNLKISWEYDCTKATNHYWREEYYFYDNEYIYHKDF